jgi:tetratricopeptide (TPR) repeat protein
MKAFNKSKKLFTLAFIVVLSVFLIIQYQRNKAERQWIYAFRAMRENRLDDAYMMYQNLYPDLKYNQFFLFNYGAELSLMKRYEESARILKEAEPRLNDADFYIYLATDYESLGKMDDAEASYTKAMNIMPAKLFPRYRLVGVYMNTGRKDQAIKMAKSILDMKVKVQSPVTDAIRQEMSEFLKKQNS